MISLRTHSIFDYIIGAVLVVCPSVFGFSDLYPARNIFLVLGFGLVIYSLLTDYQLSIFKLIPLPVHMTLDVLAGIALILAPSVFNYRFQLTGGQYALHWIMGLGAMTLVAVTRTRVYSPAVQERRDEDDIRRAA
jgi:hypothetical protein